LKDSLGVRKPWFLKAWNWLSTC